MSGNSGRKVVVVEEETGNAAGTTVRPCLGRPLPRARGRLRTLARARGLVDFTTLDIDYICLLMAEHVS